jgi:hypothetical protein
MEARQMQEGREAAIGVATLRMRRVDGIYKGIVIVGKEIKAREEGADADEVWRRLEREAGKLNPNFFGFDGARKRFLRLIPGGFRSQKYWDHERGYKLAAKERLDATVPVETAVSGTGFGESIWAVFQQTNLLSVFEKMRVKEALYGSNADSFIRAAARFALGGGKSELLDMKSALKPHEAAKWTTVTYLPFLWRPQEHMFLKPAVTKEFAARVGHRFAHDYAPDLDMRVYQSLLDLVATTKHELSELKPTDHIDVQSFIWVVGFWKEAN